MSEVLVTVKYGPGDQVTILGPNGQLIELYPGSVARFKIPIYEKEKKK